MNKRCDAKDCGSYILFFRIFTEQKLPTQVQEEGWKWKKQVVGILCLSLGGTEACIQPTALCEVFFTQLDPKTRMSSSAGCYITQLDSSHSLIHLSACLYPFKSRDLTTPRLSQAGTQTNLMNNSGEGCCMTAEIK